MNVQSLLESANPYGSMMTEAQRLVKKWNTTGLLEGNDLAKQSYGKERMAIILENQAKQLVIEQSQTGTGGTFVAGQGEQWAGVALPLVRKIFAEISSKEFVSVQPMTLPAGLVFFLEFKYGTNNPFTSNSRFNSGESMYGTTNTKDVDPSGGLYGAGRFGYSINEASASVNFLLATASYSDINYNSTYSASLAAGTIRKVIITSASGSLSGLDTNAVRAFSITGSANVGPFLNESSILAEFTSYFVSGGVDNLQFVVTYGGVPLNYGTGSGRVFYTKQPGDNSRGDFEDTTSTPLTGSNAIPEVNVELRSEPVVAKTRKLKAQWTPEFSQDLNAYQSLDAEAELTSTLSEYISLEIDLEIIDMLIENANTTDAWSAQSNTFFNKSTSTWSQAAAGAGGYYNTQGQWFATLGTKIQQVARTIHKKTLRGQANVLMTSPSIATIIESIPGYAADTDGSKEEFAMGSHKAGQLNSRYKVYVNPYMNENVILMAFKGSQFLETGAAFCPYIPLIMTPLLYDPNTFTPRKGLMTRYAKKMLRSEFFGKVLVADIDKI
jgi:hypothetical protein